MSLVKKRLEEDEQGEQEFILPLSFGQSAPPVDYEKYVDVETLEDNKRIIHIYFHNEIGDPEKYVPILKYFHTATNDDRIVLHICSEGGQVYTALTICHAIGSTAATTVADVTMAMSAATYIALSCDCVITHYETEFMCHDRMSGSYGHGRENRKLAIHTDKYFEYMSKKIYKGFLTDKEITKINRDAETLYMFGDEVKTRLEKWAEVNERQYIYEE